MDLFYRMEWPCHSVIFIWLFLICYNIKAEDLINEMGDFILKKHITVITKSDSFVNQPFML